MLEVLLLLLQVGEGEGVLFQPACGKREGQPVVDHLQANIGDRFVAAGMMSAFTTGVAILAEDAVAPLIPRVLAFDDLTWSVPSLPGGALFCSNPRGPDLEQQRGLRQRGRRWWRVNRSGSSRDATAT